MAGPSFPPRSTPLIESISPKALGAALTAAGGFDAVVFLACAPFVGSTPKALAPLRDAVEAAAAADAALFPGPAATVVPAAGLAGGRLVVATTGALDHDTEDVRRFAEAGAAAMQRAIAAGAQHPLFVVGAFPKEARYKRAAQAAVLGAAGVVWRPLEARQVKAGGDLASFGVAVLAGADAGEVASTAARLEAARYLARDICGTDPERMNPERAAAYLTEAFEGTVVTVEVLDNVKKIRRDYPLLAAVSRASLDVERHGPRIVRLEYVGGGKVTRTLWFAGKGVTYDTGGADLKVGGHMAGMSRDKGGAAAVAGLFQLLAERKPKGLRVVGLLGMVRNSIGPDAFVTDELITSRAGVRVRIGNTDAEGRLVLADLLAALKEEAVDAPDPSLFSIATLTGHAYRAVGPYTLLMGNGAARKAKLPQSIQAAGEEWGDPAELSSIRREDYAFIAGRSGAEDVVSCNNEPSSATARGHQFPFAFLDLAAGLRETTLPFVHIDIGGSGVAGGDWQFGRPTAAPLLALAESVLR